MPDIDLRRLRPQTQTVSVYTRHSSGCPKTGEPQWRRCRCPKYLYLLKDGNRRTVFAKTRSWEKAEAKAQEIRDTSDPLKQRERELDVQCPVAPAHLASPRGLQPGFVDQVTDLIVRSLAGDTKLTQLFLDLCDPACRPGWPVALVDRRDLLTQLVQQGEPPRSTYAVCERHPWLSQRAGLKGE